VPWAHHNLVDVTEAPDPSRETALFWHIPKSGGTTAKRLYQCMGQTLAHRVGADPRFGHDKDSEIVVFEPHSGKDWKVVNVDTTVRAGIIKASNMGLIKSHTADLVSALYPGVFRRAANVVNERAHSCYFIGLLDLHNGAGLCRRTTIR
jgi:hypothetical protein